MASIPSSSATPSTTRSRPSAEVPYNAVTISGAASSLSPYGIVRIPQLERAVPDTPLMALRGGLAAAVTVECCHTRTPAVIARPKTPCNFRNDSGMAPVHIFAHFARLWEPCKSERRVGPAGILARSQPILALFRPQLQHFHAISWPAAGR
jgi:hypothetical protein